MKFWNKDFILLIQGQMASSLGDALYSIIVGLWIYDTTGSTTAMGIIFSAASFARLIAFPFTGIIVDRFSRRNLIIWCDFIRGIGMLGIGLIAMFLDVSSIALIITYSIVSGICSGIFNPSMNALILNVVSKEHFVQANSIFYMANYGVDIIGQALAGGAYILFGAPIL